MFKKTKELQGLVNASRTDLKRAERKLEDYKLSIKNFEEQAKVQYEEKKKLEEELYMLINDKEYSKERVEKAESLKSLGLFADDYVTTFAELEIREISYKLGYDNNIKYELMRLASSKWGKRIIKLALKLKLNKLLR